MNHSGSSGAPSGITTVQSTGVDITEQSFIWEIKNFPVVAQHDQIISSQKLYFNAIDGSGQTSTWVLYLQPELIDGKRWIGIFYNIYNPTLILGDYLYSQLVVTLKNRQGKVTFNADGGLLDTNLLGFNGWGFRQMVDAGSGRKSLDIQVTFKLYSPGRQTCRVVTPPGPSTMEQELVKGMLLATLKDYKRLPQVAATAGYTQVTIRSRDGKEFQIGRRILTVRSPVFEAMFRTNMTEANRGLIEFPEMTGRSLEVFLHFIENGVLLPQWKEPGVILELTNGAAQYQLPELLKYLDFMLGKVCRFENVAALLALANQLGLGTAEEEILKFIREKGASSTHNFCQIFNGAFGVGPGPAIQQ